HSDVSLHLGMPRHLGEYGRQSMKEWKRRESSSSSSHPIHRVTPTGAAQLTADGETLREERRMGAVAAKFLGATLGPREGEEGNREIEEEEKRWR
ncbi:hypothetical protein PFISCL1PPCAC_25907, partial [Pristionchus fissidentatus]